MCGLSPCHQVTSPTHPKKAKLSSGVFSFHDIRPFQSAIQYNSDWNFISKPPPSLLSLVAEAVPMKSRWWCGEPDPRRSPASRASFTTRPTSPPPRTTTPPPPLPADALRTWAPAKLRRPCRLSPPTTAPRPPAGYWSTAPKPATAAASAWGHCRGGPRGGRPRSWTGNPDTCTTLTPPR